MADAANGGSSTGEEDAVAVLNGLRKLFKALRLAERAGMRANGMGAAQLFVLHQLGRHEPLSINELAALTATDQSSVSVVVNKLVAKQLVKSVRAVDDARRASLTLTSRGRAILRRAPVPFQELLVETLSKLPRTRVRVLRDSLDELTSALGMSGEPPSMFFEDGDGREPSKRRRTRR